MKEKRICKEIFSSMEMIWQTGMTDQREVGDERELREMETRTELFYKGRWFPLATNSQQSYNAIIYIIRALFITAQLHRYAGSPVYSSQVRSSFSQP
jgi:hypothetical protein